VNYYNEFDIRAALWLRELIREGLIPAGDVDTRSITDVKPHELTKYAQCHFFAGIGGWSLALELAGWESSRTVWTGSCPCQPFSIAGTQLGDKDERHLWPTFFNLIRECRPNTVFGEQVANAVGKGWLDGVSSDLEGAGYACGAAVLGAHSVGAPHIRQRLFWMADAKYLRCNTGLTGDGRGQKSARGKYGEIADRCSGLADAKQSGSQRGLSRREDAKRSNLDRYAGCGGADSWSNYELIPCRDGKARRIESGLAPLAHGVSGRVGLLRGYGNAIVPQVAAEFITAFKSIKNELS